MDPNMKNDNFDISKIESGSSIRDTIKNIKTEMLKIEKRQKLGENLDREDILSKQFSGFSDKYPTLFQKIINRELENDAMLEHMLSMLDRVKGGNLSEFDASVDVGKKLYNTHVAPKINKKD